MIQDLNGKRLDNSYYPDLTASPDDIIFCFSKDDVFARKNEHSPFPHVGDIVSNGDPIYLFSVGDKRFFLDTDKGTKEHDDFSYINVRELRRNHVMDKDCLFAMFTAYHLYKWYSSSRYCGICGAVTVHDKTERAMRCTKCGNTIYPRINPAVIVGVTNGDKLLLTRYAKGRGVSFDALVAGFAEIGETLEQTVEREVMEEVGLRVKNIRYYKSQPWGLSGTILTGFYCDVDGSDDITLDKNELSSAKWVNRTDITGQPDNMSLTNEMMIAFRDGKK